MEFIILAGGVGSRSLDPEIPKILQSITSEIRHIDLLIDTLTNREEGTKITFLLGYKADAVISYTEKRIAKLKNTSIKYVVDTKEKLGTAGALLNSLEEFDSENLICVLGDIATNIDFDSLANTWLGSGTDFFAVVHPTLHPEDSDIVNIKNGRIESISLKSENTPKPRSSNLGMAGVYGFKKSVLAQAPKSTKDISNDLIPALIRNHSGLAINSSYYIRDLGTPGRLLHFRKDFIDGSYARRGGKNRRAIFLDRDGTIFEDKPNGRISLDEIDLEIAESIARANESGIPIFQVSNQPQIAKGFISESNVQDIESRINMILSKNNAFIDDFRYCPHHPMGGFPGEVTCLKKACECRKPNIGMFLDLAKTHNLDVTKCVLIGDSDDDQQSAKNCHMSFIRGSFDGHVGIKTSIAIQEAIERILE
jgi:D-glycero-D-manno-heptose 1,7-bisphosphate phosphatase